MTCGRVQAARSEVDWPLGMVLRSVVTSRQNVGGGHRGGKRSRKDNRLSEGGLRVMAMSLFCAIIFVTTFSMQAPPQVFHRDYESMGSGCEEGRAGVFPGADSGPLGRDLKKGH